MNLQEILAHLAQLSGFGGQAPAAPAAVSPAAPAVGDMSQQQHDPISSIGAALAQALGQQHTQQPFDIGKLGSLLHPTTADSHLGMSGQPLVGSPEGQRASDPLGWLKANNTGAGQFNALGPIPKYTGTGAGIIQQPNQNKLPGAGVAMNPLHQAIAALLA